MPPSTDFDPARVAELRATLSGYVERGDLPGLVALVARGDALHVEVIGDQTRDQHDPMRRESLFRISSMTKPITAAAALMLIEDGRIGVDQRVETWLPELADRQVLRRIDAPLTDTVPARRSITVRDLLTSCLGFGSVLEKPGTYPIQKPIREHWLGGDGPEYLLAAPDPERWMRALGELPLMYQPGERYTYNTAYDVLGVLIARASGQSLGTFLRERLFEPLGMHDTGFSVSASKLERLCGCYRAIPDCPELERFDATSESAWSRPRAFESGAGGLVSTAGDYFKFCRMLLNKGRLGAERLLSSATVEAMTRDQLVAPQRAGAEVFFGGHASWGFGLAVDIAAEKPWNHPGRFGWDGGLGSSAYSDPSRDSVGILLTQRLMDSPDAPALYEDFWRLADRILER